jgi:DNA-binding NarL/FixJ family response regulator
MSKSTEIKTLYKSPDKGNSNSTLTLREKEIIRMHMKGKNRKDIARAWNIQ